MTERLSVRAARGSLWLGLVNLVSKGSQMAMTIALATLLTEADLGLAAIAVAMVSVGQVIQSTGVYDVIARTERDPDEVAGTLMVISVCAGAALALCVALCATPIAGLLGAPGQGPLIALSAASLPFSAAGGVQMAVMHRTLSFHRRLLPDSGSAVIGSVVTVILAVSGLGAYSVAFGMLCIAVLQPLFGVLIGVRPGFKWNSPAATEAYRWVRIVGPAAIVASLLINVDYPIISRVLGPDAVGVYSLAFRIAWVPYIMIAVVLGAVAFPSYSELLRSGRRDRLRELVGAFTHAVLVVVGGAYVLIALMADHIVLLGDRWEPAVPVLVMLAGYGIGISVLYSWYEAIRAVGHARWYLAFEVAHLALLVAGLLAFTRLGVVAAAAVQLVAAWLLVPVVWRSLRAAGIAPPVVALRRAVVGWGAPTAACLAVAELLRRTGVSGVGADASLAAAAWELTVLVTCFVLVAVPANLGILRELWHLRPKTTA